MRVVEKSGKSYTVKGEVGLSGLSPESRLYVELSDEGHSMCLSLEAAITAEEQRSTSSVPFFPITIGRWEECAVICTFTVLLLLCPVWLVFILCISTLPGDLPTQTLCAHRPCLLTRCLLKQLHLLKLHKSLLQWVSHSPALGFKALTFGLWLCVSLICEKNLSRWSPSMALISPRPVRVRKAPQCDRTWYKVQGKLLSRYLCPMLDGHLRYLGVTQYSIISGWIVCVIKTLNMCFYTCSWRVERFGCSSTTGLSWWFRQEFPASPTRLQMGGSPGMTCSVN